ncbi:hypothetical protein POM88_047525 [Heracleum sosnowskyi]|uniref:Uncharacterized protein n=1 Tax=Heracleum sosnowskyi TaxID=360622 RepID=A0AAD8GU26_9APIA|nr:hypothetical protein POM88_047525 [Heracleum sosnowskyi]
MGAYTSYSDVTIRSTFEAETTESHKQLESSGAISCDATNVNTASDNYDDNEKNCQGGFHFETNPPIPEISYASDKDDVSHHSERREQSRSLQKSSHEHQDLGMESKQSADCGQHFKSKVMDNRGNSESGSFSMKLA